MPLKDRELRIAYNKKYHGEHKEEFSVKTKEKRKEHPEIYKERHNENEKKYREKNKIRKKKYREDNAEQIKEYMDINREKYRDNKLKKIYGMSVAGYNEMLKKQDGKCAICGKEVNKLKNKTINFNIDHDHETGEIRGLLCNKCNVALAGFEENLKSDKNFTQKVNDYLLENK